MKGTNRTGIMNRYVICYKMRGEYFTFCSEVFLYSNSKDAIDRLLWLRPVAKVIAVFNVKLK